QQDFGGKPVYRDLWTWAWLPRATKSSDQIGESSVCVRAARLRRSLCHPDIPSRPCYEQRRESLKILFLEAREPRSNTTYIGQHRDRALLLGSRAPESRFPAARSEHRPSVL